MAQTCPKCDRQPLSDSIFCFMHERLDAQSIDSFTDICSKTGCLRPTSGTSKYCPFHIQASFRQPPYFFRQSVIPPQNLIEFCKYPNCLSSPHGTSNYCTNHHSDERKGLLRAKTLTDLATQRYQQEYYEEILRTTNLSDDVAELVSLYLSPDPLTKLKSIGSTLMRPKSLRDLDDHGWGNWYYVALYSPLCFLFIGLTILWMLFVKVGAVAIQENDCPMLGILLVIYGTMWIPMAIVCIRMCMRQNFENMGGFFLFLFIFHLIWAIFSSIFVYPMDYDNPDCSSHTVYYMCFYITATIWVIFSNMLCAACRILI